MLDQRLNFQGFPVLYIWILSRVIQPINGTVGWLIWIHKEHIPPSPVDLGGQQHRVSLALSTGIGHLGFFGAQPQVDDGN